MNVRAMRPDEIDAAVSVCMRPTSPVVLRTGPSAPFESARNSQPQTHCRSSRFAQTS
jgi:hypothetical protein